MEGQGGEGRGGEGGGKGLHSIFLPEGPIGCLAASETDRVIAIAHPLHCKQAKGGQKL
jgi:hypothetical protein